MKRVASILFTTLIVCAWDVRPQAASTTTPTIDQWLSLKTILKKEASPRISPDGRSVAYSIRTPVWETNSFDDQIWIADVSSGESYQLTEAKGSSSNIKWSPDGKRIAFVAVDAANSRAGGEVDTLRVMNVRGGRSHRLPVTGDDNLVPTWCSKTRIVAVASRGLVEIDATNGHKRTLLRRRGFLSDPACRT